MNQENFSRQGELRRGVVVFIGLAAATVVEYISGILKVPSILLWVIALIKAGLVVWYFMHLGRLFSGGEGGH